MIKELVYKCLFSRLSFTSLIMIVMLQSCGLVYDDVEKNQNPETDSYLLSIQLYTGQPLTRASDDIVAAEGNEAESYIDFEGNDYRVILFDSKGEYITQLLPDNLRSRESDQTKYIHKLWFEIPHGQGFSLPQDISKLPLYVIVLTNWQKWSVIYPDFTGISLAKLWDDSQNYNFTYSTDIGTLTSWLPNIYDRKQLIPMFGIGVINNFNYDLSQKKNIGNTTVNLIRALAKIEIELSDELFQRHGETSFEIQGCTLTTFNNSGRLISDLGQEEDIETFIKSNLVSEPSIPSGCRSLYNLQFVNLTYSDKNKFVAYIPEMATGLLGLDDEGRPRLNVTISCIGTPALGWESENPKTRPLELANYDNGEPDGERLFHVLRNHIYSYTIEEIKLDTSYYLSVKYTVCEWVTYDISIGFD